MSANGYKYFEYINKVAACRHIQSSLKKHIHNIKNVVYYHKFSSCSISNILANSWNKCCYTLMTKKGNRVTKNSPKCVQYEVQI